MRRLLVLVVVGGLCLTPLSATAAPSSWLPEVHPWQFIVNQVQSLVDWLHHNTVADDPAPSEPQTPPPPPQRPPPPKEKKAVTWTEAKDIYR